MLRSTTAPSVLAVLGGLFAIGAAIASAETPQPVASGVSAKPSFTTYMRVDVESPNRLFRRQIMPGDVARTGERISVTAWSDQAVYLYVINYNPKGWSELLFPTAQPVRVGNGEKIRVPEPGTSFSLLGEPGEMTLRVVGSRALLDEAACKELRLQCPLFGSAESTRGATDKQQTTKPPPPPPQPAPERADKRDAASGTRGGNQSNDDLGRTISSPSNEIEQAWLWFPFRQEN